MYQKFYDIVNKLSNSMDREYEDFDTRLKYIKNNYAGDLMVRKELELSDGHQNRVNGLVEQAGDDIEDTYEHTKERINRKFAYTTSRDNLPDIEVLKAIQLTRRDVEVMLEQYKGNYLALRLVAEAANSRGMAVTVPTLTSAYEYLETVRTVSDAIVGNCRNREDLAVYLNLKMLEDTIKVAEEALNRVVIGDLVQEMKERMKL